MTRRPRKLAPLSRWSHVAKDIERCRAHTRAKLRSPVCEAAVLFCSKAFSAGTVENVMTAENTWSSILSAALDGASIERPVNDDGANLLIRTQDGRSIPIEVKWAAEGWPQDVRRAVKGMDEAWPPEVVVLARHLSPGSIEWLRERGANWADETGQARIIGPNGLIVIREPAPSTRTRESEFSWSASALSVAEAILAEMPQPLRAKGLSHRLGWSLPQVANVLKAFDEQGWTEKRGPARGPSAHRWTTDRDALLADWSAAVVANPRSTRFAHRAERNMMAFLSERLAPALGHTTRWAVSGWAGLELAAPFATNTPSLHVYVDEQHFAGPLSEAMATAGLREVDDGARVTFWSVDPRVLRLVHGNREPPVVSAPRLYADLSSFGARGQDAADHVREQLIDPLGNGADG